MRRSIRITALALLVFSLALFSAFRPCHTVNLQHATAPGPCDSIPALNQQIIDFAGDQLNKKVGDGDSWDLAAATLSATGATWDGETKFGRKIDPQKECVYAGDIIQFDKLKIEYKDKNISYVESLSQHTAIIYEVLNQESFVLIEQNTGRQGHKVGTSPLEFKNIKAGKYRIYRPVK